MAGMESILCNQLALTLREFCITNAATNKADHVVIGRPDLEYRDDIVLSIYTQHPRGAEVARDYLASGRKAGRWSFPNESGGGVIEAIVGIVQVDVRKAGTAATTLVTLSDVVERVKTGIDTDRDLISLTDDHNGTLLEIEVVEVSGYDGTTGVVSTHQRWVSFLAFVSRQYCRD